MVIGAFVLFHLAIYLVWYILQRGKPVNRNNFQPLVDDDYIELTPTSDTHWGREGGRGRERITCICIDPRIFYQQKNPTTTIIINRSKIKCWNWFTFISLNGGSSAKHSLFQAMTDTKRVWLWIERMLICFHPLILGIRETGRSLCLKGMIPSSLATNSAANEPTRSKISLLIFPSLLECKE